MSDSLADGRRARFDLEGRIAVITGGAGGIGLAAARRFVDAGAAVSLWDASKQRLADAEAELGSDATVHTAVVDVSSWADIQEATRSVRSRLGSPDILVNAAGLVRGHQTVDEYPEEVFDLELAVNLKGPFLACKALVGGMRQKGYGRIVNIASISGHSGNPTQVGYSASKGGLVSLTKSLAREVADDGVLVNAIVVGSFDTQFYRAWADINPETAAALRSKIPLGRIGQPDEAAAMIVWMASDDCSFTTGVAFDLTGGRAI
jgi:2-dehydro-3-deoxy-L-rhamnonate dehydrogenase (NAD+)